MFGKVSADDFASNARALPNVSASKLSQTDSTCPRLSPSSSSENHQRKSRPSDEEAKNLEASDSESCSSTASQTKRLSSENEGRKSKTNHYSNFNLSNEKFQTKGRISRNDGRLNISINDKNDRGYLAKALGASFVEHFKPSPLNRHDSHTSSGPKKHSHSPTLMATKNVHPPSLNIVVMVIGSRGDIQPFLKLGKSLKNYGHRVRIATHPAFKEFVEKDSELEFFSVGGDPSELMAFMVKNPGMIPTMETLKKGEVGRKRSQMADMFEGFWRACISATDDEKNHADIKMLNEKSPFVADAIIANPPSFAHIHCAERLGIPLHLMFTFPYSPTQEFPHPLANIKKSNLDLGYTNFMSYPLVEMMTWQGLGDLVNKFRVKTLGLEPVSTLWAPGQLYRLKVPYTYLWSPTLVPKPDDWGEEIDIAGFVFLELASSFTPPKDLISFLNIGPAPVYIGFGSIVVEDSDGFTRMILDAIKEAGVRAVISEGWGGLGKGEIPDNVFLLGNVPHDWLFPKVSAVIHHGGAGTTAAGMKFGKPTMIVPFFGDQRFWGERIEKSGAGAPPVPHKSLTASVLADGIRKCLTIEVQDHAQKIAENIRAEGDGAENAVASFHRHLELEGQQSMRCSLLKNRVAVWSLKKTDIGLSALAAELLVRSRRVNWKQLRLIRHKEWNDFEGPGEPLTGGATAIVGTFTGIATGIGSIPFKIGKNAKKRLKRSKKRKAHANANFENKEEKSIPKQQANSAASDNNLAAHRKSHSFAGLLGFHGEDEAHTKSCGEEIKKEELGNELSEDSDGPDEDENAGVEMAHVLKSSVGKSFHNAPRLYGDTTVRRPVRITGIRSGLKAAGEEFVNGIYDGFTGLVVQPYTGARDDGLVGFIKGVGMGFTGFILKDFAAVCGPFGYTLKGVHKEMVKHRQPTKFIRKARIVEGNLYLQNLDEAELKREVSAVQDGWPIIKKLWREAELKHSLHLKDRARMTHEHKTQDVKAS
ncbi:unnamed protein product [Blumeria hordei]|uniref:Uncharacterized protein n=1 Tax=Blumeria hordei TaxID=2867405 RepID=A0A383V2N1_BLUHO|nr:unnamed protein product [Blumeria hordei]